MEPGQSAVESQNAVSPQSESDLGAFSEGGFSESAAAPGKIFEISGKCEPFTDGHGPLSRWERARGEPGTVTEIVQRCAEGERVKEICRSKGWPYSVVAMWISEREDVARAVGEARRIWAEDLAVETVQIADSEDENVPSAKLRVETRFKLAGKLDREKWGETVQHTHVLDPFGELLKRVSERNLARLREQQNPEKGIAGEVVSEVPAVATPVAAVAESAQSSPAPVASSEVL